MDVLVKRGVIDALPYAVVNPKGRQSMDVFAKRGEKISEPCPSWW